MEMLCVFIGALNHKPGLLDVSSLEDSGEQRTETLFGGKASSLLSEVR